MHIFIDYRPALRFPTGVGLYLHYLVRSLLQIKGTEHYTLFSSSWRDRLEDTPLMHHGSCTIVDRKIPVKALNFLWHRLQWPPIETLVHESFAVAHSPTPMTLPTKKAKKIITVHDLWFLKPDAEIEGEMGKDYPRYFSRSVNNADLIFTVSNTVAAMLWDLYPEVRNRTWVIPHGTPEEFFPVPPPGSVERLRRQLHLPESYLLSVGALIQRKNLPFMLDTLQILKKMGLDVPLVLCGNGPLREEIQKRAQQLKVRLHLVGYLPRSALPALYAGASVFLITSYDEGFGLPLLEAMASGIPVVGLANGAIPEVVGDSGFLIHPPSTDALADAVRQVLTDTTLHRHLSHQGRIRARDFTWERSAELSLQGYHAAASS